LSEAVRACCTFNISVTVRSWRVGEAERGEWDIAWYICFDGQSCRYVGIGWWIDLFDCVGQDQKG
jgi:hypothetical protein